MRQRQIAFGDNTVAPAVTRLKLTDLVIPCNSVRIAWGKMDCLTDGELVGQIRLLHVRLNKTFRELNKHN